MKTKTMTFRPTPFYFLNTASDPEFRREAISAALGQLKDEGFGGCVLFNKPPTGFSQQEFLGEKWFRMVRGFVEEALPLGLEIWINDDFNCPPGDAGGRIEQLAPHLKQQRLELDAGGNATARDVPWGFPAFEEPESSRLFIELVYEPYKRHLGEFFGRGIVGFFSDSDGRRMPYAMLNGKYYPWSSNFSAAFETGYGYKIQPYLRDLVSGHECRASVDYWRLAGRLYQQWFANNHAWCRKNHLKYTFHTSDTGPRSLDEALRSSIFNEGDAFELHAHADFPGTDHELRGLNSGTSAFPQTLWIVEKASWGEPNTHCRAATFSNLVGDVRAKLAASAAFLSQRRRVMCECFAATNWSVEPGELRQIAAWQIMQGINWLVPHAAHHRVFGDTKYYAPPELTRYGVLSHAMRELNDELAALCATAASGELVAPVAVLDPTEEIWRTGKPCPRFFELCAALNRLPYGYVVAPRAAVMEKTRPFAVAFNPGMTLTDDERRRMAAAGTVLLDADELERLPELIQPGCGYQGAGQPHFMRRKVDAGDLLLVANIEDEREIAGTVSHAGREYPVALRPGEIAVFSPDGSHRYRRPEEVRRKLSLARTVPVRWDAPNRITLFRWENAAGTRWQEGDGVRRFRWRNREAIPALHLLWPAAVSANILVDAHPVLAGKQRLVFDENYRECELPGSGAAGEHELTVDAPLNVYSPGYLEGEFDCAVAAAVDAAYHPGLQYYNFTLNLPLCAVVTLGHRRDRLDTARSWAEQGHPFYSGVATYELELTIPADFKRPALTLDKVHCRAELLVNGVSLGSRSLAPFVFELSGFSGHCRAGLRVENTLGNMLDGYGAPSGLGAIPELVDRV